LHIYAITKVFALQSKDFGNCLKFNLYHQTRYQSTKTITLTIQLGLTQNSQELKFLTES